jgi:hypothetical protein
MNANRTFSAEEAQAVRDAFFLAKSAFNRSLTTRESTCLAKEVMTLAATGCTDVDRLATRAIIRVLC